MMWLLQRPAWVAALTAIVLRAALMAAYPALFGGDSVVRLANADRIFLSYQLPALKIVIHGLWLVWPGQWGPRIVMALLSGIAAAGMFRFARQLTTPAAALVAALLFALNPFIAAYSIVPYQEMLMLAGLSWAFAWAVEDRPLLAAVALAVACLTRYEAWLACPGIVWILWNRGPKTSKTLIPTALACGAGPLGWMLYNAGITPAGSFAIESTANPERLWRWIYLGWITAKNAWFALPAAALGAWEVIRTRRWREPVWTALLSFAALFAVAILFSAHGDRDQPDRFVSAREAHLALAFTCLLAGVGWARLGRRSAEVATAMFVLSLLSAQRFVARETSEPHTALAYQAARELGEVLEPGQRAVVLAAPTPRQQLGQYLAAAERRRGQQGRNAAIGVLRSFHVEPPGYQRILVQTSFTRDELISWAELPPELVPGRERPAAVAPDWALLWSDFEPSSPREQELAARLAELTAVQRLEAGGVSLDFYRLLD